MFESKSQEVFSRYRHARVLAEDWSSIAHKRNRIDAKDRSSAKESVRSELASRALGIMLRVALVGSQGVLGDASTKSLRYKLLKGLRARTLRLRAQSAEKASRWISAARRGILLKTPEDIEEYLADISTQNGVGVSTYERARYGLLYLEAAAGRKQADCISLSPAVKATIQELEMRTLSAVQKRRKQAPQWLTSMLRSL